MDDPTVTVISHMSLFSVVQVIRCTIYFPHQRPGVSKWYGNTPAAWTPFSIIIFFCLLGKPFARIRIYPQADTIFAGMPSTGSTPVRDVFMPSPIVTLEVRRANLGSDKRCLTNRYQHRLWCEEKHHYLIVHCENVFDFILLRTNPNVPPMSPRNANEVESIHHRFTTPKRSEYGESQLYTVCTIITTALFPANKQLKNVRNYHSNSTAFPSRWRSAQDNKVLTIK